MQPSQTGSSQAGQVVRHPRQYDPSQRRQYEMHSSQNRSLQPSQSYMSSLRLVYPQSSQRRPSQFARDTNGLSGPGEHPAPLYSSTVTSFLQATRLAAL